MDLQNIGWRLCPSHCMWGLIFYPFYFTHNYFKILTLPGYLKIGGLRWTFKLFKVQLLHLLHLKQDHNYFQVYSSSILKRLGGKASIADICARAPWYFRGSNFNLDSYRVVTFSIHSPIHQIYWGGCMGYLWGCNLLLVNCNPLFLNPSDSLISNSTERDFLKYVTFSSCVSKCHESESASNMAQASVRTSNFVPADEVF
jgi:hypothetical protein